MSEPADIRLLVLDVDGVLTDGRIIVDDLGNETKHFHVRDGLGIRLWLRSGFEVALLTGRTSRVVTHRAQDLGIRHVIQGSMDKCADLHSLIRSVGVSLSETAAIGDDLVDLPVLRSVGYPMTVSDAVREVRDIARFITLQPGGTGAVREAVEHLLREKHRWMEVRSWYDPALA